LTVEQGYEAAKLVGLNLLATLHHNLGDLDRVKRVVKLFGLVNCVDGFAQQPAVVNGCSDLMVKVFGENGSHVRSAVGTNALPLNVAVEVEAVFELHPSTEKK
jgi:enamine deaminase RidA (YjgF/YER057c/UK114 family)